MNIPVKNWDAKCSLGFEGNFRSPELQLEIVGTQLRSSKNCLRFAVQFQYYQGFQPAH